MNGQPITYAAEETDKGKRPHCRQGLTA
jgi:hypothetical protein